VGRKIPPGKAERREETGTLILQMRGAVEEALARYPKIAGFSRRETPPLGAPKEEERQEQDARSTRYLGEVMDEAPGISGGRWTGRFFLYLIYKATT
jgi:hypothetical protein